MRLCWYGVAAYLIPILYCTVPVLRLLRRIAVNRDQTYFDTDVGDHHHFYVEIDNAAAKWILRADGRQPLKQRWALRLSCFDFTMCHRSGESQIEADSISRAARDDGQGQGQSCSSSAPPHERIWWAVGCNWKSSSLSSATILTPISCTRHDWATTSTSSSATAWPAKVRRRFYGQVVPASSQD